jgi:predicted DNA binding CopG/RHH family protein
MQATMLNPLDKDEENLLSSIENDEFLLEDLTKKEKRNWQKTAIKTLNTKVKNINLKLSSSEAKKIEKRAQKEGLNTNTLINTLLHQYLQGKIKLSV